MDDDADERTAAARNADGLFGLGSQHAHEVVARRREGEDLALVFAHGLEALDAFDATAPHVLRAVERSRERFGLQPAWQLAEDQDGVIPAVLALVVGEALEQLDDGMMRELAIDPGCERDSRVGVEAPAVEWVLVDDAITRRVQVEETAGFEHPHGFLERRPKAGVVLEAARRDDHIERRPVERQFSRAVDHEVDARTFREVDAGVGDIAIGRQRLTERPVHVERADVEDGDGAVFWQVAFEEEAAEFERGVVHEERSFGGIQRNSSSRPFSPSSRLMARSVESRSACHVTKRLLPCASWTSMPFDFSWSEPYRPTTM